LNEETVTITNKAIAETFGSFENFTLTTLSIQNNYFSFVRSTNTQRKDVVMENLGLGLFASLFELSKSKIKETNAIINALGDTKPLLTNLQNHKDEIAKIKEDDKSQKEMAEKSSDILKTIDGKIKTLSNEIKPINCIIIDEKTIKSELEQYSKEMTKLEQEREKVDKAGSLLSKQITKSAVDIQKLLKACQEQVNKIDIEVGISMSAIKKHEQITKKYGEINCKDNSCILLIKYKEEAGDVEGLAEKIATQLGEKNKYLKMIERLEEEIGLIKTLEGLTRSSSDIENKIVNIQLRTTNKHQLLEEYNKNKSIIEENKKIQVVIDGLNLKRSKIIEIYSMAKAKIEANKKLKIEHERQIENINLQIEQLFEMRRKANALIVYRDIMSQNALPNTILNNYISILEGEVNRILGTSLGLSVKVSLSLKDGNKRSELDISFKNTKNEWHPIEAASGAEEMLLSLAIRVALINITSISRCNMLVLDEGAGNLDQNNIVGFSKILKIISKMFKAVIIISHLEEVKTFPDKIFTIEHIDGASQIIS